MLGKIVEILKLPPLSNRHQSDRQESREAMIHRIGGAEILLVENNYINSQVAQEILKRIQIQVTVAEHGAEALDQLKLKRFDLVLMDIQMPIMDGYEATRLNSIRIYRLSP
ncbi:response regulator [Magnetococcales bacterium HHB-1]